MPRNKSKEVSLYPERTSSLPIHSSVVEIGRKTNSCSEAIRYTRNGGAVQLEAYVIHERARAA